MQTKPIKKVVIAGGGTAGWMAAAAISKLMGKNLEITLVESEMIGTIGVGEATVPGMPRSLQQLGIDEREFFRRCNATFKTGVDFLHRVSRQRDTDSIPNTGPQQHTHTNRRLDRTPAQTASLCNAEVQRVITRFCQTLIGSNGQKDI